jgi:hypothetical protein
LFERNFTSGKYLIVSLKTDTMKNTLSLLAVAIWMLHSGITANAQKAERIIITDDAIADVQTNSQKGEIDTAQQKKMIIIQKRLQDRNKDLLDIQKELKDLQSLDQLNIPPVPPIPGQPELKVLRYGSLMGGNNDLSELRLTKSFKGESVETTKKFSVTADNTSLNFNLSGQVKSGIISVTLFKPNGSKYKAIEIDPTSDISYSQGIDLKKDPKEWTGDWQIKIKADKADGNYRLNIMTR